MGWANSREKGLVINIKARSTWPEQGQISCRIPSSTYGLAVDGNAEGLVGLKVSQSLRAHSHGPLVDAHPVRRGPRPLALN